MEFVPFRTDGHEILLEGKLLMIVVHRIIIKTRKQKPNYLS